MNNAPTEKQIKFVEEITSFLGIEFPASSKDFNKYTYSKFIKNNIEEFKYAKLENYADEEYCNEICVNDVWCEQY